jgi:hypothetical protein
MKRDSPRRSDDHWDEDNSPDSRPYVHKRCGEVTVVSGNDFRRLANPFDFVPQTYCVACEEMVGLDTVAWDDTGETISRYRRRLRAAAPVSLKLFSWVICPLGGAALGAGAGWLFTTHRVTGAFIGAFVGLVVTPLFVTSLLLRWVWRLDYRGVK